MQKSQVCIVRALEYEMSKITLKALFERKRSWSSISFHIRLKLNVCYLIHWKKNWHDSSLLKKADATEWRDRDRSKETDRDQLDWEKARQIFTNEIDLCSIQQSSDDAHDLSDYSVFQISASLSRARWRFCARNTMNLLVSIMMKALCTNWICMNCRSFTSCFMNDTRCVHWLSFSNHESDRCNVETSLNKQRVNMTHWNCTRRAVAVDADCIDRTVVTDSTRSDRMTRFINEDSREAVFTEVLFYFSLRAEFSHDVACF